jgi:hypothetical protein
MLLANLQEAALANAAAGAAPGRVLSGAEAEAAEERYGTTAVEEDGAGGEGQKKREPDLAGGSSIAAMLRECELSLKGWRQARPPDAAATEKEQATLPGKLTGKDSRCCPLICLSHVFIAVDAVCFWTAFFHCHPPDIYLQHSGNTGKLISAASSCII